MAQIDMAKNDVVADSGQAALTSGTTYFFPVGAPGAIISAIHAQWDAAIIITALTVEDSNNDMLNPRVAGAAGDWIQENPPGAYVGVVGAGASATNLTVAVTGGAAGGAMIHLGNLGSRKLRVRVVVGGTGGILRLFIHGKE